MRKKEIEKSNERELKKKERKIELVKRGKASANEKRRKNENKK